VVYKAEDGKLRSGCQVLSLYKTVDCDERLVLKNEEFDQLAEEPTLCYLMVAATETLNGSIPAAYGDVDNWVNAPVVAWML
jgi:hypothetical protein